MSKLKINLKLYQPDFGAGYEIWNVYDKNHRLGYFVSYGDKISQWRFSSYRVKTKALFGSVNSIFKQLKKQANDKI